MPEELEAVADAKAQEKYRRLLESVGFSPEVSAGVAEDVFSAVREAEAELRAL